MLKLILLVSGIFILSVCAIKSDDLGLSTSDQKLLNEEKIVPASILVTPQPLLPYTARFEIYTHQTKRTFTDKRYHNQSPEIYILSSQPNQVIVTKTGITWKDFFQTLPMSLTASCLVTGTKQTFCTDDKHTLRFSINGVETPDALNSEIKPDDFLSVEYGDK